MRTQHLFPPNKNHNFTFLKNSFHNAALKFIIRSWRKICQLGQSHQTAHPPKSKCHQIPGHAFLNWITASFLGPSSSSSSPPVATVSHKWQNRLAGPPPPLRRDAFIGNSRRSSVSKQRAIPLLMTDNPIANALLPGRESCGGGGSVSYITHWKRIRLKHHRCTAAQLSTEGGHNLKELHFVVHLNCIDPCAEVHKKYGSWISLFCK